MKPRSYRLTYNKTLTQNLAKAIVNHAITRNSLKMKINGV